jgi:membrane dipeptidase
VRAPIVDGHLDLAENTTLFGRDLTQPVEAIREADPSGMGEATVSLPELERGGIAVAIATLTGGFRAEDVGPQFPLRSALYSTPEEAEAHALAQLDLYERWEADGRVRLLRSRGDLERHLELWQEDAHPGLVLLLEGADPVVRVGDLDAWHRRGLRLVGLTFGDTRYGAGATGLPGSQGAGGLTVDGVSLLRRMAELGIVWDVSHLSDEGIRQGLELAPPLVCASHANARALTPTDRHLSDETIRAIGDRRGVVGIVIYNRYLDPGWSADRPFPVTAAEHVRRHAEHIAAIAGWDSVGIGSDLDGGFGRGGAPDEIDTVADLHRLAAAVPEGARDGFLGANWLEFLRLALPRD